MISFCIRKGFFPSGAQPREGLQVPPSLLWKKVGIKRGFLRSSCTPGGWNCIQEGFYCPILDGILGVYKIVVGGRRKGPEPFPRGVRPSGALVALERLRECSSIRNAPSRTFVSSWTIFGVDLGFSDPFPHACGPGCVQTSLHPHESFQAGITDHVAYPLGIPPPSPIT